MACITDRAGRAILNDGESESEVTVGSLPGLMVARGAKPQKHTSTSHAHGGSEEQ